MCDTEASGWMVQKPWRALKLAAVALGIGLVMVRAPPAPRRDDDDKTFEEKIIDNIMSGLGATNMKTGASNTASARRWWCLPNSICRRRLPRLR